MLRITCLGRTPPRFTWTAGGHALEPLTAPDEDLKIRRDATHRPRAEDVVVGVSVFGRAILPLATHYPAPQLCLLGVSVWLFCGK